MSRELRIFPGVGDRKCGAFLSRLDRDPHPTCARCRGKICTKDLTCDFCAVWSAEQWERFSKKRSYKERKRPSGSVPPTQQTSPRAETSSGVSRPGTSSSSSSRPLGGQGKQEGSRGAPGVVSGGAPSPPARPRSSERGGSASRHSSGAGGLAPSSPSPSGGGGVGVARSLQTPLSRVSDVVDSLQFSPHVPRRGNSRESSASCSACYPPAVPDLRIEDRGRIRGLGHERVARVDVAIALALAPLPVRGQEVESVGIGHRPRCSLLVPAHAVSGHGLWTATARGVEALGRGVTGLDPRTDTGHAVTALDVSGRGRLTATARVVSERVPLPAGGSGVTACSRPLSRVARMTARGQARDYLALLPACGLRAEEPGRLARHETQEGVEAVASQPPVVSETAAGVTPVAGGASITALPSVVQDLARFFLGLSSSSSLGAAGGIAGVTASAAASGGIACPATAAGGAATICATAVTPAGAGVLPAAPAAVSGVSGEQQRQVESRSRGRRSWLSSDGTDRRAKKRSRRRSPSPERSSRRRGRRYRSSSDSSEEGPSRRLSSPS